MFVSVVMAAYNGERFISLQIESILNQTHSDFELIIADDCSTDMTPQIIKDYCSKDKRIKFVQNQKNLGFKKNFENLLSYAKADYIAFCDQDDIWSENHLEKLLSKADNYDLVCSNATLVDSEGVSLHTSMKDVMKINTIPQNVESIKIRLLHYNFVQGATCLVSKRLLEKSIPIPENVFYHDYWFALCAAFSKGVYYFDEPLVFYRQHGSNVTDNKRWSLLKKIFKSPHKKTKDWLSQVEILSLFSQTIDDESDKDLVDDAISYYKNLLAGKKMKCISHFIKNYNNIYCNNSLLLKIMRFVELFVL